MAVFVSPSGADLSVKVEDKNGEVRLVHNGHAFVRVYTGADGQDVVEVIDADVGPTYSHNVRTLCWRR